MVTVKCGICGVSDVEVPKDRRHRQNWCDECLAEQDLPAAEGFARRSARQDAHYRTSEEHHIRFGTSRTGGRIYGHRGGYYRESEVSCSCGWDSRSNGQTYQESVQEAREHLKDMDVYTTDSEQDVYAAIHYLRVRDEEGRITEEIDRSPVTPEVLMARTGRSMGIVMRALAKLEKRGNIIRLDNGGYEQTDKWFFWGL